MREAVVTPDWSIGFESGVEEPAERTERMLSQPFDETLLTLVMRGAGVALTWELYDGPHPLIQDPSAVGSSLRVRWHGGGGGGGGNVGERLRPEQVALVGGQSAWGRHDRCGFLEARCSPCVASAVIRFDDGSTERLEATASSTTGQHWVVCCLESEAAPVRIDFLDRDENLLESQPVSDPRALPG